jgi:nucleoside-diphosphate-sugar epimerase
MTSARNVLVTGGAGFLGTYAIAALTKAGHAAAAYDCARPTPDLLTVHASLPEILHLGEIDDLQRLGQTCRDTDADVIVHLVARVGMEPSLQDPFGFYETNVMGMAAVCEAARQTGVRKVIQISSSSVYHDSIGPALVETDVPFSITRANPQAHYGTSKMAAEAIGMAYAEFHGVEFLALRVSAIYGFGMRAPVHVKPLVEGAVRGVKVRIPSGGGMKRDYIHVLDVADAIVRAVEAGTIGSGAPRVFNISSGTLTLSSDVARIVERLVPGADVQVSPEMSASEAENVKTRRPLANGLARQALSWQPQWPIERGIAQYAEAFRNYVEDARS